MPFIVRCPNPKCQKYQLVEDHLRNDTIECLVCQWKMKLSPSRAGQQVDTGDPPARTAGDNRSPDGRPGPAPTADPEFVTRKCPQCQALLRFPANTQGKSLACPKCKTML